MEQDKQQAVGEMTAGAAAPTQAAPAPDDGQVDDEAIALALATGAQMLTYIANGDLEGLDAFVNNVRRQIMRQRNLMRLLEMEQRDIDRLLEHLGRASDQVEQVMQAADSASKRPAPSEVREVYSPADASAGNGRPKTGDLHAYFGMSRK